MSDPVDQGSRVWVRLGAIDPSLHDPPPAPGSSRYDAILTRATSTAAPGARTPATTPSAPRHRRAPVIWGAAAAAVIAAVAVPIVARHAPLESVSASQMLLTAAEQTGDVTSFRASFESGDQEGHRTWATCEVQGANSTCRNSDNTDGGSSVTTTIGSTSYDTVAGVTTTSQITPLPPLPASAHHLVDALLDHGQARMTGTASVHGVEAIGYHLTVTPRSYAGVAALPREELELFDLNDYSADQVSGIDVWVARGLIRRIVVHTHQSTDQAKDDHQFSRTDFYDIGEPVTIAPPPGA